MLTPVCGLPHDVEDLCAALARIRGVEAVAIGGSQGQEQQMPVLIGIWESTTAVKSIFDCLRVTAKCILPARGAAS